MTLTSKQIEKYREIYRRKFGEDISYAEAEEKGMALIVLVKTIMEKKYNDKYEDNDDRSRQM